MQCYLEDIDKESHKQADYKIQVSKRNCFICHNSYVPFPQNNNERTRFPFSRMTKNEFNFDIPIKYSTQSCATTRIKERTSE